MLNIDRGVDLEVLFLELDLLTNWSKIGVNVVFDMIKLNKSIIIPL